jgi:hypothetical protein
MMATIRRTRRAAAGNAARSGSGISSGMARS